jgi:hypothetical protein
VTNFDLDIKNGSSSAKNKKGDSEEKSVGKKSNKFKIYLKESSTDTTFSLVEYFSGLDPQIVKNLDIGSLEMSNHPWIETWLKSINFQGIDPQLVISLVDLETKLDTVLNILNINPSMVFRIFSKAEICKSRQNELCLNFNGHWRRFKLQDSTFANLGAKNQLIGSVVHPQKVKLWRILIKQAYF